MSAADDKGTVITYAGYGVWNNTCDCTAPVRRAYEGGMRVFTANNNWCGDPSPGDRKYLYIIWQTPIGPASGVVGEDDSRGIHVP
jgi:hypothetical protein